MKKIDIQWNFILTGVFLIVLASILTTGLPFLYRLIGIKPEEKSTIEVKPITREGIEEEKKSQQEDVLLTTNNLKKAIIYDTPLVTPSFVSDPQKLANYLEKNSVEINVRGQLSEAYLYIKTGPIDVERESVYFFIVDGYSSGGHLFSPENLATSTSSEFLYDLEKLPLVDLPFSTKNKARKVNIKEEFLNKDIAYKNESYKRQYFVGGFVSTMKLPNQIDRMEIRYSCKPTEICEISVGSLAR